jgi:Uma2 family endonuclease
MAVQEKFYTADDLLRMADDGKRRELVQGVILEMTPAGDIHTILAIEIAWLLNNYVRAHDLGWVTGADAGFQLAEDPDTVRSPDVGFVSKARAPKLSGKFFAVAPDLAVEIMSPGDTASEIQAKVLEYFQAGTNLVWVVYPKTKTVAVHVDAKTTHTVDLNGTLEGGNVLPGFMLPVREIFARLDE